MAGPLNSFVYERCIEENISFPTLPVFTTEHYAQCAEDIIVASILRAIATKNNIDLSKERFLEIGGNHPLGTSSTFLLSRSFGMTGVIVEANPELIGDLQRVRSGDFILHAAVTDRDAILEKLSVSNMNELSSIDRNFVLTWKDEKACERAYINVPALRINQLFEKGFPEKVPIYMSIDIEGMDLRVLQDMDFERFRPAIIQAEPSDHYLPENSNSMVEFMRTKNYDLIARTDVNLIFLEHSVFAS